MVAQLAGRPALTWASVRLSGGRTGSRTAGGRGGPLALALGGTSEEVGEGGGLAAGRGGGGTCRRVRVNGERRYLG